jgi:competence protein ComFA
MVNNMLVEYTKSTENIVKAVEIVKNKYYCVRCGNNDQSEFFIDDFGIYCRKCLNFGKSSTYQKIWRKEIKIIFNESYCLKKVVNLSNIQKIASNKCLESFKNKRDMLLYAVCGAGKTEVVYEVILRALNLGNIVCFATPRKDVVLELVPRFKRDFFQVSIVALYGGSPDKGKVGNLYVTTTHQLINYYQFFDLVIIDEVDAFPYYNNKMLAGFIKKAKKEQAPIIYLTATPPKYYTNLIRRKKIDHFIIPNRFHNHPLPIPKIVLTYSTAKKILKGNCPKKILLWLLKKQQLSKRVFIFVPKIEIGIALEKILTKYIKCRFVYAEMKERTQTINMFRNNKIQYIITTTILERGVTVPNVDVCIINCDDQIFDERAIVQIVGRAGRHPKYPFSDVVLFCDYFTLEIKNAVKQIKKMNKIAKGNKNEMYNM